MDDPLEKDYATFHEKLKTSSPEERPSLYNREYNREIERLGLWLREERLGYEHAKVDGEFLDEAEIEDYLDRLALLIEKLRYERSSLESGKPVQLPSGPAAPSSTPEPTPAKPLFFPGRPLNRNSLTVEQAAEYLGMAKQTVYQWCSEKKIPYKKIGSKTFFDADELDSLIAKRNVKTISEVVKARLAKTPREEPGERRSLESLHRIA